MPVQKDDLRQLKLGTAALAACIVRTLQKSDPDFEERFLATLSDAYYHFRDDADGEVVGLLELLSWTRELLTGWNMVTGQGEPFLKA
jgi:hypothetical protein